MKADKNAKGFTDDEIRVLKKFAAELLEKEGKPESWHRHMQNTLEFEPPRPTRRRRYVLSDEQVKEMRKKYAKGGVTLQDLAFEYGVSASYVWRLVRRKDRA